MADQVTNYKCPACGGALRYDEGSGRLECDYCDSSFSVEEVEALYAEKDEAAGQAFADAEKEKEKDAQGWDTSGLSSDWGADAAGMRAYNCPSCGAQLICDATTAATSCPYCGNPSIVPGQFGGTLRPDFVIPFKLSKEAAVEALKKHYRGKRFLPKSFSEENHINEIKGLYVPFWLFDGVAEGSATYTATRSHTRRTATERITTTEHFNVHRAGRMSFERVPADGSTKMPDDYMDSIEPFDYSELRPFSTAYLPGFMADKYDVDADASVERVEERCSNSMLDYLRGTVVGYESCTLRNSKIRLHRGRVSYALLPVWVLATKWKGKNFLFTMNGQTGKMVGDLPVDRGKFWLTFAEIALPIAAVIALLASL